MGIAVTNGVICSNVNTRTCYHEATFPFALLVEIAIGEVSSGVDAIEGAEWRRGA
ncbi:hypothetical protein YERSI8AC_240148 [Enterobacterales bacterium 8AC]|nr:hypothetical protein YERSI8AC_240148 [Enterobacterales bacterium 8AC]